MDEPEPPGESPIDRVAPRWEQVIEDMAVTAEDYEASGWETVQLHPGDVTVTADAEGRNGIDVLVPGEEFEVLRDAVEDRTFDSYEVFRAVEGGVVFVLVVLTDAADEVAVFVPAYYDQTDLGTLRSSMDEGVLTTAVRPLDVDEIVTFEHDDPEPFFP